MLLVVDNGSVYTKNLSDFLSNIKKQFQIITYEKISLLQMDQYDSFILSGRRTNNPVMNAKNAKIIKHAISTEKPLLGICYGAEILALTLGGTIKKMPLLHKGTELVSVLKENPLCSGEISVFESHSYEVSKLGDSLTNIAYSNRCQNEIIHYKNSNIFGTQFHPEMSPDGHRIIENFSSL